MPTVRRKSTNAFKRHLWNKKVTPLANLHLTLLEKVGVQLDKFADSTGPYKPLSM